jgi:DNA ligase-1
LFGGRKKFNETVSIVRSSQSKKWSEGVVTYQIFDILSMDQGAPFEDRMEKLKEYFGPNGTYKSDFAVLLEHTAIRDRDHIFEMLKEVEDLGGEGLMIRKPGS